MNAPDRLHARTRIVHVELTSRCNLACVYCAVSQPGYQGRDLDLDPSDWVDQLERLHPREVHLNGHGETTLLRGWQRLARSLLERGLPLALTTNLSHAFEPDEIDVLSRMVSITISCDTPDPELHASIRRGSSLALVERNLEALIGLCRERGRQQPYIAINAVVTDLTVAGLPDLARWAFFSGANSLSLVSLIPYPPPRNGAVRTQRPARVDADSASRSIEEARRLAGEFRLDFNVMPGLEANLRQPVTP